MMQASLKRLLIVLSVVALSLGTAVHTADDASAAAPADKTIGVGAVLGTPTGFNLQVALGESAALDFVIGGGFYYSRHFYSHAQFLWNFKLKQWDVGTLSLHVGGGLEVHHYFRNYYWYWDGRGNRKRTGLAVRVPVGVSFAFKKVPVDVFNEIAPAVHVYPDARFGFSFTIGGRYWF